MVAVERISRKVTQRHCMNRFITRYSHCLKNFESIRHTITSKYFHHFTANVYSTFEALLLAIPGIFIILLIRGQLESSVAEEKRFNPRLSKDIDTFVKIMDNLNLPKPKMIGKSLLEIVEFRKISP